VLADAAATVELEEPDEDMLALLRIEGRLEQRERIPIATARERREVRAQRAFVVLGCLEAEDVTDIRG
jgi:hypothetical protein